MTEKHTLVFHALATTITGPVWFMLDNKDSTGTHIVRVQRSDGTTDNLFYDFFIDTGSRVRPHDNPAHFKVGEYARSCIIGIAAKPQP